MGSSDIWAPPNFLDQSKREHVGSAFDWILAAVIPSNSATPSPLSRSFLFKKRRLPANLIIMAWIER
jgi:hypothetical protein